MITPEYVDYLIGLSRTHDYPVASAELKRTRISDDTVRYDWVVNECPCCGGQHSEFAGYDLDEVHKHLHVHICPNGDPMRCKYVMMREYDAAKLSRPAIVPGMMWIPPDDWEAE